MPNLLISKQLLLVDNSLELNKIGFKSLKCLFVNSFSIL